MSILDSVKPLYRFVRARLHAFSPRYFPVVKIPLKFSISGTTAATIDLGLVYVLKEFFDVYYLLAASVAFAFGFFVSFYLQKFWTFRDDSSEEIHNQALKYLVVGLTNTALNAVFVFLMVENFAVWYLLAQAISGSLLSIGSFMIYKFVIFRKRKKELKSMEINRNL